MNQSGLDAYLQDASRVRDILYAGYSAGSCAAGPTLKGLHFVDDPHVAPRNYSPQVIWEGLGLMNHTIIPHYKSNHPESAAIDKTVEYCVEHAIPFTPLRDGEVLII